MRSEIVQPLELTGHFNPKDFVTWKLRAETGNLYEEWASKYPQLFSKDDVALAQSDEAKYHFYEWCGAIHFYNVLGYHCLVEQYAFGRKYPQKWATFCEIVREFPSFLHYPNS